MCTRHTSLYTFWLPHYTQQLSLYLFINFILSYRGIWHDLSHHPSQDTNRTLVYAITSSMTSPATYSLSFSPTLRPPQLAFNKESELCEWSAGSDLCPCPLPKYRGNCSPANSSHLGLWSLAVSRIHCLLNMSTKTCWALIRSRHDSLMNSALRPWRNHCVTRAAGQTDRPTSDCTIASGDPKYSFFKFSLKSVSKASACDLPKVLTLYTLFWFTIAHGLVQSVWLQKVIISCPYEFMQVLKW